MINIKNESLKKKYYHDFGADKIFTKDTSDIMELLLYEKNEYIIKAGEVPNYLFLMLDGKARSTLLMYNGNTISLGDSKNFQIFGEASALWQEVPVNSVIATHDCLCLAIPLKKYRSLLLDDLVFVQYIAHILSLRLKRLGKEYAALSSVNAENRLAMYILRNCRNNCFISRLTSAAEALGISYRHILRLMKKFCKDSILKKENRKYIIIDKKRLQQVASNYDI